MFGTVPEASDVPGGSTPICPPACRRTSANQNLAILSPIDPKLIRAFESVAEA